MNALLELITMLQGFIKSILSYGKAFQLIQRFRLWFYVFVPGLISLCLGILIALSVWNYADDIGNWMTSWYSWKGEGIVEKIGSIISGIAIVFLTFLLFKYIIIIAVSPFMSLLSEKVERRLKNQTASTPFKLDKFLKDMVRGLSLALRNIFWELLFTVLLLLVSFIFPIIAPFTAVLIFIIQAYYAGFGNMDFTMERHFNFKESVQFVRRNRGLAIGNGAVFLWMLLTGIGFLFAPTLATIAGTVEVVKVLEEK
ncbi:MAG: EI24 domain-containing protein [Bacteroidota bacterium]